MPSRAAIWELYWDGVWADPAVASQRWILSVMQSQGPALVKMLWRMLGNESDVCDAYQDTFLQLAHPRGGGKPANVNAFVFRTASNVAVSMLRRRKVHERACRALVARSRQLDRSDQAEDLDSKQLIAALRTDIARLPDHLRSVIVLRDLAEMPYRRVAEILNISTATARVYRCRGIQLLANWMIRKNGESDAICE